MRIAQISEDFVEPEGYDDADDDDLESFGDPSEWMRQWYVIIIDTTGGRRNVVYPNQEHPDPDVDEVLDGPYVSLADAVAAVEGQNLDTIEVECGDPIRHFWLIPQEELSATNSSRLVLYDGGSTRLTVDGHEWSVRRDETQPGTYEYTWLTAPSPEARGGFSVGVGVAWDKDEAPPTPEEYERLIREAPVDHEQNIREHMAMVNPTTGLVDESPEDMKG